jgi:hypothetical protein
MGNIGNAGFFMGPQMGQGIPPGYMNKIVSWKSVTLKTSRVENS